VNFDGARWRQEDTVFNVIGVDIGGTHFRTGLFDQEGRRLIDLEGDTLRSGGREWMLKQVHNQCRKLMDQSKNPVKACGVSFGGPVDFSRQRVRSMSTPGWDDFALAQWVEENLSLPCRVDNDANCGALGEFRAGAGRGTRSLVYITLSTGVGGGMVLDGKVYRGKDSLAGEFGHLPMADSGPLCSCGARGCLETYCSGPAIAREARQLALRRPEGEEGRMANLSANPESISARAVFQAAAEGDAAAAQIIGEAARWLARTLRIIIRIVNPDKIVLGGGVTAAGDLLMTPLRAALNELSSSSIVCSTEVQLAELGQFSPLQGAACNALDLASSASI
jgi:glucokinase